MMAATLLRGGLTLAVDDGGGPGMPVVFQHGLCGDASQAIEVFPPDPRLRRITLECRGHGQSEAGDRSGFRIATFAEDVAAMIEARCAPPVVVGGISMGAAIALRLAIHRPDLVRGLVLARPAWLSESAPTNMAPNAEVARLLADFPAEEARALFLQGATASRLARDGPDNLVSLQGFFTRRPVEVTEALLAEISADGPGVSLEDIRGIDKPTLVLGHGRDAIHPLAYAETLASMIRGARLVVITAKADDRRRYVQDFRDALHEFLVPLC